MSTETAVQSKSTAKDALKAIAESRPGDRIPPERVLALRLGIGRAALRILISEMRADGLIESVQGSGNYAVDPASKPLRRTTILIDPQIKLGDDPFFSLLVDRLQCALQDQGVRCQIERGGAAAEIADGEAALLLGKEAIGLAGRCAAPCVALLAGPSCEPTARTSVFRLDDRAAGKSAANRLIERGCANLVFAGRGGVDASRERREGVREAASEAGIGIALVECSLNFGAGIAIAAALPISPGVRTGIVAANDWLATGLSVGLTQRLQDPDDRERVHLASFDGLASAAGAPLMISSMRVPIDEIAADAVAELLRLAGSAARRGRLVRYALSW